MPRPDGLVLFRRAWTAFLVAATSAPYLMNYLGTPAGWRYTWILPPYPEDSFGYMAWSRQAAHGSLLLKLKYTALPHAGFLFHPFFLTSGWLSALSRCDIGVVHWALKGIGVALFMAALHGYLDFLGLSRFQSILASLLAGVSSGLGGLLAFLGLAGAGRGLPADLWVPDVNTFQCLLWNPLFPYSLALLLTVIHRLDRGSRDARPSDFWIGGLATGVLALIHPYSQPLLFLFAAVVTVARRGGQAVGCLFRYLLAALPGIAYVGLVGTWQPLLVQHSATGAMRSPALPVVLLGFGAPLFAAVAGAALEWRGWVRRHWPVVLWFLLSLLLAYAPFWFQLKFLFGAHVALSIMAAVSFDRLLDRATTARSRRAVLAVSAIALLPALIGTPLHLLAAEAREVRANPDSAYYVGDGVMRGLDFLRTRTKPDEVVFALYASSRLIPAYAGNAVLWGHWAMSVDAAEREKWFEALFPERGDWEDPRRAALFWGSDIRYIFADDDLQAMMRQEPAAWRAILAEADEVFSDGPVIIYRRR